LFGEEIDILTTEFKMDLLIYDSQTDFDYFITRIKGKVTSKTLLDDAAFNSQVWRYGVKFLDMDNTKENLLQTYFRLRGKIRS